MSVPGLLSDLNPLSSLFEQLMMMDPLVCRWILEFLLRQGLDDALLIDLISAISPSPDARLRKTLILRQIESDVSRDGPLPEDLLTRLEILHELHRSSNGGAPFFPSKAMKDAYRAVAVECTVQLLRGGRGMEEFANAVERIWNRRIADMEVGLGEEGFGSDLLGLWAEAIAAALVDDDMRQMLMEWDTRAFVMATVPDFVCEEWRKMGPSHLQQAARSFGEMGGGQFEADERFWETVARIFFNGEENMFEVDAGVVEGFRQLEGVDHVNGEVSQLEFDAGDAEGLFEMERDSHFNGNEGRIVVYCGNAEGLAEMERDSDANGEVKSEQVEFDGDAGHAEGLFEMERNSGANGEVMSEDVYVDGEVAEFEGDAGHAEGFEEMARDAHVNVEEVEIEGDCGNAEGFEEKARYSNTNEEVRFEEGYVHEEEAKFKCDAGNAQGFEETAKDNHLNEKEGQIEGDDEGGEVDESDEGKEGGDGDAGNVPFTAAEVKINKDEPRKPSLMERNSTARTFEWDDSIDDFPEVSPSLLPNGRQHNPGRRTIKKWSVEEEDTLRIAVQKYGKGNWKIILNCYSDVFKGRTQVDIKDKWRRMTK